ncbi:MAG: hypothetical protein HY302_16130 [Opitutae bacterium]|nr:hypothetical protein [Opitutae bacterium]
MPVRWFRIFLSFFSLCAAGVAAAQDYPSEHALQRLDPARSLPENVELLKKSGVARAEINRVLANASWWWDDLPSDLGWLNPAVVDEVKAVEAKALQERRQIWRDRLTGELAAGHADEASARSAADKKTALSRLLSAEQFAEYVFRTSAEFRAVKDWAWGLELSDAQLLKLTAAEMERRNFLGRAMKVGPRGRAGLEVDAEAGELARIRAARHSLESDRAAVYLQRADTEFSHWVEVLRSELGMEQRKIFQLYALRHELRLSEMQLERDRTVEKALEKQGVETLLAECRAKAQTLLGASDYRRYTAHPLGAWLKDKPRAGA